jgi:D-amino peptidase
MTRALLIADLEGVTGVDSVEDLLVGSAGYPRARERLTAELNHAIAGLLAAGFQSVRVSDSHECGSGETNVLRDALHPAAELCLEEDWYSPRLFEGVDAVACVGMHAGAGSAGFAAHTVNGVGAWDVAGRRLSESDLVLGLAAEAGVPVVFISGDDVLEASLAGRVGFVRAKQALSASRAFSREPEEVHAELARAAALPPRKVEPLPEAPLVLTFKSTCQADLAEGTGARRLDRYRVALEGGTFRERYARGLRASAAANSALGEALRGGPGSREFIEDACALLQVPHPPAHPPASHAAAAERALQAFLALTARDAEQARALRALTLHMLEGLAPGMFARWNLRPVLEEAVAALASMPMEFPLELHPEVGMARVDALYVRHERGLAHPLPEPQAFRRYLEHLDASGYGTHAWLLGALLAACGLDARLDFPERAMRPHSRIVDCYWVTHLYLLDTRYLRRPLTHPKAAVWTEELLLAVPWLIAQGHVDLGAEVAFCLQVAGEVGGGGYRALMDAFTRVQGADGRVLDGSMGEDSASFEDHSTAAFLLAFAGAEESRTGSDVRG